MCSSRSMPRAVYASHVRRTRRRAWPVPPRSARRWRRPAPRRSRPRTTTGNCPRRSRGILRSVKRSWSVRVRTRSPGRQAHLELGREGCRVEGAVGASSHLTRPAPNATEPGTCRRAGSGGAGGPWSNRSRRVLDDRAQAAAEVERRGPMRAEREDLVRREATAGPPAIACTVSRRSAGGSALDALDRGIEVDQRVEHLGLVAQDLERAQDVGLGRGVDGAERGQQLVAHPVARVGAALVGGVLAPGRPRSAQCAAVSSRVQPSSGRITPGGRGSRAARAGRARRRAGRARSRPGRCRVTGGDHRAELRRLAVAHLRAHAWTLPRGGPGRRTSNAAPSRSASAAQCASSASASSRRP